MQPTAHDRHYNGPVCADLVNGQADMWGPARSLGLQPRGRTRGGVARPQRCVPRTLSR